MSDQPAPALPLSEAEARDFHELGLTPGCWAALAPVPMLMFRTWRVANPDDIMSFRTLCGFMPEEPGRAGQPEEFWARVADSGPPEAAQRLFRAHLTRLPDGVREGYLTKLGEIAGALFPGLLKEVGDGPVRWVRDSLASEAAAELPAPPAEPLAIVEPPPPVVPSRPVPEVETASDFKPLPLAVALARANRVSVNAIRDWLANHANTNKLLFDNFRIDCPEVAIVTDPDAVPRALWVVGDIHADALAMANIIEYARQHTNEADGPPAFLFLGDFVDRGRLDHETLLLLFDLLMQPDARVCIIPGNHDIDLRWGEKSQKFGVTIQPAEYCERLNGLVESQNPGDREQIELAKLAIEFWKTRPKAVFLPDGSMYSHGGFPHTDTHESLKTRADLGGKKCLDDFLWARLSESPKKRPNRGNRGHEFGSRDFAQFCSVLTEQLGVPVKRLVRGHDHVPRRWLLPPDYAEYPVLTINAMGWRLDGEPEPADGPHPFPVVARHVPGELPCIFRLPLNPVEVERTLDKLAPPDDEPAPWFQTPLDDTPPGTQTPATPPGDNGGRV